MFKNKKIYMIGIGGISMSGIALLLTSNNNIIKGSDKQLSDIISDLRNKNIEITIGYNLEAIKDSDIIVYTAAIKEEDKELKYAKKLKKEIYERSEFLGILTKEYENVICISGTHGKSTTTGMISTIFLENNLNPTIQIGAILPSINSNTNVGKKKYFIMEACEYNDSFLKFNPTSIAITNIDSDHLDYFKNLDNIKKSFNKYVSLLPKNGKLIINNDDENSLNFIKDNTITYGINNNSNYMAKNISYIDTSYDLYVNNNFTTKISLNVLGLHNIYNSLAAIALSNQYIQDIEGIKKSLLKYTGVKRRFEYIKNYNNVKIYDDYAHHPNEIKTTYNSLKSVKHKKHYIVFQPHTYSRTYEHLDEFAKILSKFDEVIIAPIYAAREENIYNIKEDDLVNLINKYKGNSLYINSFDKIINYLKNNIKDNDLILTLGAGIVNDIQKEF